MTEIESDSSLEAAEPPAKKGIVKRFLEFFSRTPETKEALEQELQELLEEGEEHGLIGSMEEQMISSILDFRETLAVEVMTPAAAILSLDVDTALDEITSRIIEEGFTRIPVYRENPDSIIGILHVKDLLRICILPDNGPVDLTQYLRPVDFVRENKPIVEILRDFQKHKTHMAMVIDEFGAVRGLITMEDIIEEIVGEIDDEYDVDEVELEVLDRDTVRVKARIDIEEIEKQFGLSLPEGPYESVGGLLVHALGRIGRAEDALQVGNLLFTIKSATRRSINTVEVARLPEEVEE